MENVVFQALDSNEMETIKGGGRWVYDEETATWMWIDL